MHTDLINPSPQLCAHVTQELAATGMAVVREVTLPSSFEPPVTDIVLLSIPAGIEIYLGAGTRYRGDSDRWLAIDIREPVPGNARLIGTAPAGASAALHWLQDLLRDAGGYWSPSITLQTGTEANSREVSPPPVPLRRTPDDLTDLSAVQTHLDQVHTGDLIDEAALLARLQQDVRGQDAALRVLASRIYRHCARPNPGRPATVFAIGPTGVGKTCTAETLAAALPTLGMQNQHYGFLRLDMSEYQEEYRVSQLLGAPQGYAGYYDGAQLIDALAANPCTVVLFDEIEKAHPAILRMLMNALDTGRISTARQTGNGHTLDVRRAIFFFTSNLGSRSILQELTQRGGFDDPNIVDAVCRSHLRAAHIPPELIARLSTFMVFRPLNHRVKAEIVALSIVRVAAEYGLQVEQVDPAVVICILDAVPENDLGARPYEYQVDSMLGDLFAGAATTKPVGGLAIHDGPPFSWTLYSPSDIAV